MRRLWRQVRWYQTPGSRNAKDSTSGHYALMRNISDKEVQALPGYADLRRLREERDELRALLSGLGLRTLTLQADELSPFSSRLGRYFAQVGPHLVCLGHPDGQAERAERRVIEAIREQKWVLPLSSFRVHRHDPLPYSALDVVDVNGMFFCGISKPTDAKVAELLYDLTTGGAKHNRRDDTIRYSAKAVELEKRGILKPLSKVFCSPDQQTLVYDATVSGAKDAVKGTGAQLLSINVLPGPAYVTEVLPVSDTGRLRSMLLPRGFPEVLSFVQQMFSGHLRPFEVSFAEHMKLGISLREVVVIVRPGFQRAEGYADFDYAEYQDKTRNKSRLNQGILFRRHDGTYNPPPIFSMKEQQNKAAGKIADSQTKQYHFLKRSSEEELNKHAGVFWAAGTRQGYKMRDRQKVMDEGMVHMRNRMRQSRSNPDSGFV